CVVAYASSGREQGFALRSAPSLGPAGAARPILSCRCPLFACPVGRPGVAAQRTAGTVQRQSRHAVNVGLVPRSRPRLVEERGKKEGRTTGRGGRRTSDRGDCRGPSGRGRVC